MRETDLEKLEEVKLVALKMIVEKGYHGATISLIAKKAGVSDGYLYRHYANKNERNKLAQKRAKINPQFEPGG